MANALSNGTDPAALQAAYEALQAAETDSTRPRSYLNYLFFDEQMQLVAEQSRLWQADGESDWKTVGTDEAIEVPENGYIAVYLSNQGAEPVYYDNLAVTLTPGALLEEKHYYPYGLPIQGWGTAASGSLPNRQRYQGNEYREEAGLNWMDFHNRQYDPQLGRFLGVDALAAAGGQQALSPYHAMACNPAIMVDPLGLRSSVYDNGARPFNTPDVPMPVIPYNTNARFILLDRMMYADQEAFHQKIRGEMEAEAEGEVVVEVLKALYRGLSYLGFESKSVSAVLGRKSSAAGEVSYSPDGNKFEGIDAPFPKSGVFRIGKVQYDLYTFIEFYNEYGNKFQAKKINSGVYGKEDLNDPKINGKSVAELKAEAGSYLVETDLGDGYKAIGFFGMQKGKGTSYGYNYVETTDLGSPNHSGSLLKIHTHPFGNISYTLSYSGRYGPIVHGYSYLGPSPGDYKNSFGSNYSMRHVVIDNTHIYLYNYNSSQTIRIKYAK